MSIKDLPKKYLKYKNKYLNTKYDSLQIGSACKDKYILLSCNEFNNLVDGIIEIDVNSNVKSSICIINEHNNKILEIETKFKEIVKKNEENISRFTNDCKVIYADFYNFIKDTEMKETAIIDTFSNPVLYKCVKDNFLRKQIVLESDHFYRGYINWKTYADNTPDIKMNAETVKRIRGGKVIFFAYFSFNEPNVTSIITQLLFLNSLNHYGVSEINIVLPYFPVGTMERIIGEGEVPTAYSLAHMLNMIPSGASKNNLYIFDIHALCSRFFFHTNTRPVLVSMMPAFITKINEISNYDKVLDEYKNKPIIVFPDDGAKKRFEKLVVASKIKTITCSKTRIGDTRKIRIDTGLEHFKDKQKNNIEGIINLFLIDDLVQTGGTLLETFKGLYEELDEMDYDLNNIKCFAIVTHSIFPDESKTDKFFCERYKSSKSKTVINLNITLITTNSRPTRTTELVNKYSNKVDVIDIKDALKNIFTSDCMNTPYIAPYSIN